ncbi:MAG TPA: DUF4112 domain-containing protein [Bacteroidia bacterium]|nr:DUF4112 domain-containing protein [Bacteroidia bacterium]
MPDESEQNPGTSLESSIPEDWRQFARDRIRTSRRISWLLDECIRIPGTQVRFGLDPLLGLIPYGGETAATLIGTLILGEAGKKGLPLRTLARMGGNMLLNAAVGVVPVLGDLFSFWFKSNSRNYRMLKTYLDSDTGEQAEGGWWPVILIASVVGAVVVLNIAAWLLLAWIAMRVGSLVFS